MSTCVKCGNKGYVDYYGQGSGMRDESAVVETRYCKGGPNCNESRGLGNEHLDKRCLNCRYGWAEPCKDAKP